MSEDRPEFYIGVHMSTSTPPRPEGFDVFRNEPDGSRTWLATLTRRQVDEALATYDDRLFGYIDAKAESP